MFKRALKKLRTKGKESEKEPSAPAQPVKSQPSKAPAPQAKILTAEGWKRLMMKKYRKS